MPMGIVGMSRQIARSSVNAKIVSTMLSARKTRRPIPSPIGTVTPGARNFRGVSRNEIAKTIPSHTKTIETAATDSVVNAGQSQSPGSGPGFFVGHVKRARLTAFYLT